MNIEIKADTELLTVLVGIKDELKKLNISSYKNNIGEAAKTMSQEKIASKEYTLQQVRAKLATLEAAKAKELITAFGVKKLTDLPQENYEELMKKVGEI